MQFFGPSCIYVHAVRGGDDPAVTDDAASTLVTPRATTMRQAHQPRPRMWHSLGAADDAVEHQRTDIRHSAVAACISTALTMTSQLDIVCDGCFGGDRSITRHQYTRSDSWQLRARLTGRLRCYLRHQLVDVTFRPVFVCLFLLAG